MKIKSSAVVMAIGLVGIVTNIAFANVGPMWLTIVSSIASVYAFGSGAYVLGAQKGLAAAADILTVLADQLDAEAKAKEDKSTPSTSSSEEANTLLGSLFDHYKQ